MLFNSFSFLVFLPTVFIAYYVLPHRFRALFLLLASCYFYASFVPKYLLILFFVITVDYFLASVIQNHTGKKRALFLLLSILTNLGVLFFFKYFNFFNENVAGLLNALHFNYDPLVLSILLPLGLSFHVFQSLSYVIEVYKGRYAPEKNYIRYALYVMFFPQLVAGPIERPAHLLPQLTTPVKFDPKLVRRGFERILWGFFKKVVIADQLAQVIDPLYADPPTDAFLLVIIAIMFTYQLYCDFSGYSDIAIGSAMVLGFELTENFNRPFAARTFADFWRRWHISLSSWLRDYLYYPLAFGWGRISKVKLYISLLATFTLIGLWHGAKWTYVVFGAMHGVYLFVESITEKSRKWFIKVIKLTKFPVLHHTLQIVVVFLFVTISFIVFRSENLHQAMWIFHTIITGVGESINFNQVISILSQFTGKAVLLFTVLSVVIMEVIQYYQSRRNTFYIFDTFPKRVRYSWYYFLLLTILMFGYFGAQSFIYFQF